MTALYRPVLIEAAEQAEALPVGTLATRTGAGTDGWTDGAVRVDYGDGWQIAGYALSTDHEFMIGWTALVPVEAEEEYSTDESESRWSFDGVYGSPENVRRDGWDGPVRERYVTEWEEM